MKNNEIKVSIITPTYNRQLFLPFCFMNYVRQDYPRDLIEILIGDDSDESCEKLVEELTLKHGLKKNVKYHRFPRMTLGKKRNELNNLTTGNIIVAMDDDDFYPYNRVSHVVEEFKKYNFMYHIAGASRIYLLNLFNLKIYETFPFKDKKIGIKNHGTNGTFAYTKAYIKKHKYNPTKNLGEEASFTNNFTEPMIQLESEKSILCIIHNWNTFEKPVHMLKTNTTHRMMDFIKKDRECLEFILNLSKQHSMKLKTSQCRYLKVCGKLYRRDGVHIYSEEKNNIPLVIEDLYIKFLKNKTSGEEEDNNILNLYNNWNHIKSNFLGYLNASERPEYEILMYKNKNFNKLIDEALTNGDINKNLSNVIEYLKTNLKK